MKEGKYSDFYTEDDEPVGCRACGNPAWPECMDSCPLFDD